MYDCKWGSLTSKQASDETENRNKCIAIFGVLYYVPGDLLKSFPSFFPSSFCSNRASVSTSTIWVSAGVTQPTGFPSLSSVWGQAIRRMNGTGLEMRVLNDLTVLFGFGCWLHRCCAELYI